MIDLDDFPLDIDIDYTDPDQPQSTALKRKYRTVQRRAFSEKKLLELLDAEFETDTAWHVISGGDIDSLSYLKHIIKMQPLDYCLLSTWCMALDDILQLQTWLENGQIKKLDAYVGEIFPNSYRKEWAALTELLKTYGGRVCVFRNHSKIYAGTGSKFSFAIESSANINTNPRAENTVISTFHDLYQFYKNYFDGIKSFDRSFDNWSPHQP